MGRNKNEFKFRSSSPCFEVQLTRTQSAVATDYAMPMQSTTGQDAMSHNDKFRAPWSWHVPLDTVPDESAFVREMWELMQETLPEDAVDWANDL